MNILVAVGALVVTESASPTGSPTLLASTAGGYARLTPADAEKLATALLDWARAVKS